MKRFAAPPPRFGQGAAMRPLKSILRPPLLLLAFLYVVIEETIWGWAKAIGGLVARIPLFAAIERLILRLEPHLVLALFAIPIVMLLPVKLAAVWLIGSGRPLSGLVVLLGAKTIGTAFSARLYVVAEPKLMTIALFARARNLVAGLLARAHAYLDASHAWQAARRAELAIRLAGLGIRSRLLGSAPSLLARVRAVRRTWREPA